MAQLAGVQTCGQLPYSKCQKTRESARNYSCNFRLSPCWCQQRLLRNNTSGLPPIQNTDIKAELERVTDHRADLACCDVLTQQLDITNKGSIQSQTEKLESCSHQSVTKAYHASHSMQMDTSSTAASSALYSIAETYRHWFTTASHCCSTTSRPTAVL